MENGRAAGFANNNAFCSGRQLPMQIHTPSNDIGDAFIDGRFLRP